MATYHFPTAVEIRAQETDAEVTTEKKELEETLRWIEKCMSYPRQEQQTCFQISLGEKGISEKNRQNIKERFSSPPFSYRVDFEWSTTSAAYGIPEYSTLELYLYWR